MGSNVSSNGTHCDQIIEPMLSVFESDLPLGSTIKRKPSVMQPKIPLTNTTRYLALQSDDALVEVVNSSSSDASSLSSSEVSSLSGGYTHSHHSHNHNHNTANSHQICGTLKSGTLRRSATDERLKTRIYEPLQKRYQNIDNNISNGAIIHYNNSIKLADMCPPSSQNHNFELISNSVVDVDSSDTLIDSLPLPPPPQVLTNSLSTLSLNWLPPPPADVLHYPSHSHSHSPDMSSMSSSMSMDSITPKASPVMSPKKSPQTPQIAPKPKIIRRLSETAYDRPIYINGFKKGSSLTLQKLLKYFKRSLSAQNNKNSAMDLKSVSCYATLPRTTKARVRPPVNLVKKLCPQSSNTSPSIIESRTHSNADQLTTTPPNTHQSSPNHIQKYSTISSPKHFSQYYIQQQRQQKQQLYESQKQQQQQQQSQPSENLYKNVQLEQLLAEFESEYQILEQQIQSYNTTTTTATSNTSNTSNNSNNVNTSNNNYSVNGECGAVSGAPQQSNSANVMSNQLENYNNMDQTPLQSQIYYVSSQHTNYSNGMPIAPQHQQQQQHQSQQCYQRPKRPLQSSQPLPQQLPQLPPHASQSSHYQSYSDSQLQSQIARHMSQTQSQYQSPQHIQHTQHMHSHPQQQQQLEQYSQRIYESNHISNAYQCQPTQSNMCAINNQTYVKSKLAYNPHPCSRSPMKGPLPPPPETFLREIQRVMDKKWKVAQTLSTDMSATPNQILGFRDPVYLPPNGNGIANSANIYDTVATQRPIKSVRISSNVSEIAVNGKQNGKHRRLPPPPPKRSVTTQLSHT